MRLLILIFFIFLVPEYLNAQEKIKEEYFSLTFDKSSPADAVFLAEYFKTDSNYKKVISWNKSRQVKTVQHYSTEEFDNTEGLYLEYYESGQLADSMTFDDEGEPIKGIHYYADGKLRATFSKENGAVGYNAKGAVIKKYIYTREAELGENNRTWKEYLGRALNSHVPIRNGAPAGQYSVIVKFIIDANGKVNWTEAETNHGYGMEEEACRVIQKSPKWKPAIQLNTPVKAYRRQPVTFVVADEK